jgi:hypothetical protein
MEDMSAIYKFRMILPSTEKDNIIYFITEATIGFIAMLIWTYFAYRASFDMTKKSSHKSIVLPPYLGRFF